MWRVGRRVTLTFLLTFASVARSTLLLSLPLLECVLLPLSECVPLVTGDTLPVGDGNGGSSLDALAVVGVIFARSFGNPPLPDDGARSRGVRG